MRRTNRRHTRAMERHRRNKGPALFSKVADEELEKQAKNLVTGLCEATIKNGSAAAASLLIGMAESAEWAENPALYQRASSLAEKWANEPPFVSVEMLDTAPQMGGPAKLLQLTSGSDCEEGASSTKTDAQEHTLDAEVEDLPPAAAERP